MTHTTSRAPLVGSLLIFVALAVSTASAQFPPAGDDALSVSATLSVSSMFSTPRVVQLTGNACVSNSAAHAQGTDPSGVVGDGSDCPGSPAPAASDGAMPVVPFGFNAGGGTREIHIEIRDLSLTQTNSTSNPLHLRAGSSVSVFCPAARNLGEAEARGVPDFPADSFFDVYLELSDNASRSFSPVPVPIVVRALTSWPPIGRELVGSVDLVDRVPFFDCTTGELAYFLESATFAIGSPGAPPAAPALRGSHGPNAPSVFSVGAGAEGLFVPAPPTSLGPNEVWRFGPSRGYSTQGDLFETDLRFTRNYDRMTSATGISDPSGDFGGPFGTTFGPAPPGSTRGTWGMRPGDDLAAVSFGCDDGDLLAFSVSPASSGAFGSAVRFASSLAPVSAPAHPSVGLPANGGGDPGEEAAGDVFLSAKQPLRFGGRCTGEALFGLRAAVTGSNVLYFDEIRLGLQAPASAHSAGTAGGGAATPPEDDLDALELSDGDEIDSNEDGKVDSGRFAFFTLAPGSPSLGAATPADVLVATAPAGGVFAFSIYARGVADIGLVAGDAIDALALFDAGAGGQPDGVRGAGDEALFSLRPGSPSLSGSGTNPHMPGVGPFSPGDVFRTALPGPPAGGPITLWASASSLGLLAADDLDALDLASALPCTGIAGVPDTDGDGVGDPCDNCPLQANPIDPATGEQKNSDGDPQGDACDSCVVVYDPTQMDRDGDGVGEACDNCESFPDPDQTDLDGDQIGDVCDDCIGPHGSAGVFGQTITAASKTTFSWATAANVEWTRTARPVSGIGIAAAERNVTSITDLAVPPAGTVFWYLVRKSGDLCSTGSFQSSPGAEPARDADDAGVPNTKGHRRDVAIQTQRIVDVNGDLDGYADTNETADLYVTVRNRSAENLTNVVVQMSSSDPKIDCIIVSTAAVGALPAFATIEVPIALRFKVDNLAERSAGVTCVNPGPAGTCSNFVSVPSGCSASSQCVRTVTDDYSAALDFTISSDQFAYQRTPQRALLDLDLNIQAPVLATSTFLEGFEAGFASWTRTNFDENKATNTLSDGYRCQYNDPDDPSSNSFGEGECYLGFTIGQVNGNDWHVHDPTDPDGGRASAGQRSLHYGIHAGGDPGLDTTGLSQLDAIRTTGTIRLAPRICRDDPAAGKRACTTAADCAPVGGGPCVAASSELSFKQQISSLDSRVAGNTYDQALDRGVVQLNVLGTSAWKNLEPYVNLHDAQGTDEFRNCTFDPIDDGSDEDDRYPASHPPHGPSSTCFPEFVFSYLGDTDQPFATGNMGRASDGPSLAGSVGPGVWVESRFDLSRYRGRQIRIRFLYTTIKVSDTPNATALFQWYAAPEDDGWYVDDIRVTSALGAATPTITLDTANNAGLPACP